jgi:predicted amidohydrolase
MKEGIALIDVDLKQINQVRKEWSFLKDRRPEAYREITETGWPSAENRPDSF